MGWRSFAVLVAFTVLLIALSLCAQEDVIKNGDFASDSAGWDLGKPDADQAVRVAEEGGKKCLVLQRNKAGVNVSASHDGLRFKPQTLYKLTVTGKGTVPAIISLRPQSSKDKDFFALYGSHWGVSNCRLLPSTEFKSETLLFDSGLKADGGFLILRLANDDPGSYCCASITMTEAGSSAPNKDELVVAHIGDSISITAYLPFSERIDALLNTAISKDFPNAKIRNLNIAAEGEYAKLLIESGRYQKAIKENFAKIDVAVIRYGANDIVHKVPHDETRKYMLQLCESLEKDYPGIRILIGTGPYVEKSDQNPRYAPVWELDRELAKERKYPLIDIYKRIEQEHSIKTASAPGDMHPSAYGVTLIADEEYKALKPVLEECVKALGK